MGSYIKLKNIKLSGYKSIKGIALEINDLNVLIGANGSGKSNLVSLFKMLNHMTSNDTETSTPLQNYVRKVGGANSILHFGVKRTSKIDIELNFCTENGRNHYSAILAYGSGDTLYFADEKISFTPEKKSFNYEPTSLGGSQNESKLNNINSIPSTLKGPAKTIRGIMNKWRFYQFHDTSSTSGMKQISSINNNLFLAPDASNIAPFLLMLKNRFPQNYSFIVNTIQRIAPFFEDFVLTKEYDDNGILLRWKNRYSDIIFDANQLSDGTLRTIALTALLLQPKLPSLIVIDEPELGLHPSAINLLAELIKDASSKTQIILSTQSIELVNNFELSDIVVVDNKKGESYFTRHDPKNYENWLKDYTLGELWKANVIGGRPSL